jgi:hypothetical protein
LFFRASPDLAQKLSSFLLNKQDEMTTKGTEQIMDFGNWTIEKFKKYENLYFNEVKNKKSKGGYNVIQHLLHCCAAGDFDMFQFLVEHTGLVFVNPIQYFESKYNFSFRYVFFFPLPPIRNII